MVESWKQSKTVVAAYTDTASLEGPVTLKSAAVVFPALRLEAIEALPPTVSTKGGELAAIRLALETVVTQAADLPGNLRIFTDSQEAVKECRSKNSPSVQVREIKKLATTLRSRGVIIRIEWVPGHAGIPGNEEAHQLARDALAIPSFRGPGDETLPLQDHQYDVTARDRASIVDWQSQEYDPAEERAGIKNEYQAKLEELLPEPAHPLLPSRGFGRRGQVLLTRVRTEATISPARLASWSKGKRSGLCSKCDMNAKADTYHQVWVCPKYHAERAKFRPQNIATLEGWTHPPGNENQQRKILRSLLDFLHEAKLESFI